MNTNIIESEFKITNFLKEIQKQLINYNSIKLNDLKKIISITYGQKITNGQNLEIDNLLINILSLIKENTRVYDIPNNYETNYSKIFVGLLNSRIIEELNK